MNLQSVIRRRRQNTIVLGVIFFALLTWVVVLFYREVRVARLHKNSIKNVARIHIKRDNNQIELAKENAHWQVKQPYQYAASDTVAKTFLTKLLVDCQPITGNDDTLVVNFFVDVTIDTSASPYRIGELNTVSDKVYMQHDNTYYLCDKLVASIALAPAINFVDKQLYHGELNAIKGNFGELTDFSGIDLSVLEIAPADARAAKAHGISTLTFVTDKGENSYEVIADDSGQHVLLYEPKKSIIYVIAAHPKLNAIIGL